jgi:hypothetical protein
VVGRIDLLKQQHSQESRDHTFLRVSHRAIGVPMDISRSFQDQKAKRCFVSEPKASQHIDWPWQTKFSNIGHCTNSNNGEPNKRIAGAIEKNVAKSLGMFINLNGRKPTPT